MKAKDIKQLLPFMGSVSVRNGIYTAKQSFYFRTRKHQDLAIAIQETLAENNISIEILSSGDHWAPFKGGAKHGSKQDSWHFVKFKIKEKTNG